MAANRGIEWKHITPYAPWQGGLYERLIKSIKQALHKALKGSPISSFDYLTTCDLVLTFPYFEHDENSNDTNYYPPEEVQTLETRKQAEKALQSSCALTDKFWKVWKDQYLSSLREKQKRNISNKRHCNKTPKLEDVVLIMDPIPPRND
ncbi:hypothetical protein OESDEN_06009 [Oesophagostomum dentatum]|uniref:Uncharacterized protein n=1 Tax=Oesophagostomum dentatum TaxID=61180 RepID=A0A0B1T930_OESDE|nr:hypothetical protein OESDEN_06009 [Oesophagostomum dentatum]